MDKDIHTCFIMTWSLLFLLMYEVLISQFMISKNENFITLLLIVLSELVAYATFIILLLKAYQNGSVLVRKNKKA
jgi:hypothetical protein